MLSLEGKGQTSQLFKHWTPKVLKESFKVIRNLILFIFPSVIHLTGSVT